MEHWSCRHQTQYQLVICRSGDHISWWPGRQVAWTSRMKVKDSPVTNARPISCWISCCNHFLHLIGQLSKKCKNKLGAHQPRMTDTCATTWCISWCTSRMKMSGPWELKNSRRVNTCMVCATAMAKTRRRPDYWSQAGGIFATGRIKDTGSGHRAHSDGGRLPVL